VLGKKNVADELLDANASMPSAGGAGIDVRNINAI